jgi:Xaa-Pro aminopeptidase
MSTPASTRSTRASELTAIAAAAELASAGQQALRDALSPGVSEVELLHAARGAIEAINGAPVEAEIDLLSGERTALADGDPTRRTIEAGDPILFDLAPRRQDHWADSCATLCCGTPGIRLRKRHDVILRALEAGIAAARPGASAGTVDAAVRGTLEASGLRCPHHTGHAVGIEPREQPFLVPGGPARLEEGMAIAIEPGAYSDGFGVRLEHLTVIEADGARPLTEHALSLT